MLKRLQARRGQEGFTLVELLIVIVILGILAAIVVFAVGGITDKGQTAACKSDLKSIQTAEEAYFANHSTYVGQSSLTPQYMHETSSVMTVTLNGSPVTSYSVAGTGSCAGVTDANS